MSKSEWQRFASHFGRVAVRALIATLLLWVFVLIPLPRETPQLFVMLQVPAAVFLFIVYIGKLLYDTFFFNHFRP